MAMEFSDLSKKILHTPDGMIDDMIYNIWAPNWRVVMVRCLVNHYKQFDQFCKENIPKKIPQYERELFKQFLIADIVATLMFLLESFAAIAEGLIKNPQSLHQHFRDFKATRFWGEKIEMEPNVYFLGALLALPPWDELNREIKQYFLKQLVKVNHKLNEFKDFYFQHLELYNAYKHGYRIFAGGAEDAEQEEESNVLPIGIMFFGQHIKANQICYIRLSEDMKNYLEMTEDLSYVLSTIRENHKNKLANPEKWNITLPNF